MSLFRRGSMVIGVLVFFKDDIIDIVASRFGPIAPVCYLVDGARILDDQCVHMIQVLGALVAQATDPFAVYANATSQAVSVLIPLFKDHAASYIGHPAAASICALLEDVSKAPGGVYSIAIRVFQTGYHVYEAFTYSAMHIKPSRNARLIAVVKILAGTMALTLMVQLMYLVILLLSVTWTLINKCLHNVRRALVTMLR